MDEKMCPVCHGEFWTESMWDLVTGEPFACPNCHHLLIAHVEEYDDDVMIMLEAYPEA